MKKTILERIEFLEKKGWIYDSNFRINTHIQNVVTEVQALRKGNEYRIIKNNKISKAYKILSLQQCLDNNIEF